MPIQLNEDGTLPNRKVYGKIVLDPDVESQLSSGVGSMGPAGPTGPQGPQGEPGQQGPMGPQGPEGPTGAKGDPGDTGPAGAVGPQGETGGVGGTGAQGQIGETGPQGPQGVPGIQGDPGIQGPAGADGAPGPKGDPGDQGPAGADGATGSPGADGEGVPNGVIVMWAGLIAAIPAGWALCNGLNGTPDLTDRFIKGGLVAGTTGGSATHTHAAHSGIINHTHPVTDPGHTHLTQRYPTATGASSGFTIDTSMSGTLADNTLPTKTGTTGVTTTNPAGGVASLTHDSPNSEPPYYVLAFIQKV